MARLSLVLALVICGAPLSGAEDPPTFAKGPTAVKAGDKVTVRFAVDRPTDVAVTVLDARGGVVRHLAAGMLGKNPPPPLQPNTLEQSIPWDGRDARGRPAAGAASVRVRIGLGAALERFTPTSGAPVQTPVTAMGVGRDGELYVLANRGHASCYLYALSREGVYRRTILPVPADRKGEELTDLERLRLTTGRKVPVVYQGNAAHLAPYLSGIRRQQLCVTGGGTILFASGGGDYSDQAVPRYILAINRDGSTPEGVGFVGPTLGWWGRYAIGLRPQQVAASPDGETVYFVGLGKGKTRRRDAKGIHAVGRCKLADGGPPKPFIGKPDEPGNDAAHLNSPVSVTTDAKGNLYVADAGNQRVAAFDPDGGFLGETKAERPWQLAVNPATGELFVLQRQEGRRWGTFDLIKYDKAIGGKAVARMTFKGRNPVCALDAGASPPKLWISYDPGWRKPAAFFSVLDRGDRLVRGSGPQRAGGHLNSPLFLAADPRRGRLYVGDFRRVVRVIDLKTDRMETFVTGSEAAVGPKGNVYVLAGYGTNTLFRVTPAGKPLPFEATGSNKLEIKYRAGLPHVGVRGLTVAPSGDIYTFQDNNARPMHLWVFGPDGAPKKKSLIENIPPDSACSIAVDRSDNVYVGINVNNPADLYPAAFRGVVPRYGWVNIYSGRASWYNRAFKGLPKKAPWTRMFLNFYINHYGSVFKFGPAGGRFWIGERSKTAERPADAPADARFYRDAYMDRPVWAQGVVWRYNGFALCTNRTQSYGDPGCSCWTGRFAMDRHERLFVPDVFRFSVGVVDKAGNEITRFGEYGNVDSAGPASAIPEPAIPVAWCNAVAVGGGKLYVADRINRRIAVLGLTYAAEKTCAVK
ncbi:MAG: hypothetical protein ACOC70_00750 [bacterium]